MSIFCSHPFTSMSIHRDLAMPCCWFTPLNKIPVNEYFSNSEILDVKRKFLNNEWPVQCIKCKNSEELHGYSGRQLNNRYETHEVEIKYHNTENYFNIDELDFISSNICNINCIMCYGSSFKKDMEMFNLGIIDTLPKKRAITIEQVECLFSTIKLENVHTVTFSGGEPFADKISMFIISKLIASGHSTNLILHINTNLTLIKQEQMMWLKTNFKDILIKCSIDGYDKVNEYIRYPTKWNQVEQVLDIFQQNGISFIITTALTNVALMRYYELINWAYTSFNNVPELFLSVSTEPEELSCLLLPADIKDKLRPKYIELQNTYSDKLSSRNSLVIDTCINLCSNTMEDKTHEFYRTIEYMKKYETVRKNNFLDVWPELSNYAQ